MSPTRSRDSVRLMAGLVLAATSALLGGPARSADADFALPPEDAAVARVNGETVPYRELGGRVQPGLDEQRERYERALVQLEHDYRRAQQALLENTLNQMLDTRVLELEAASRGTSPLQVLGDIKDPVVAEDEVRAAWEADKSRNVQPWEIAAPKIRRMLVAERQKTAEREFYAGLREKYGVHVLLEPLRESLEAIGPSRGAQAAPITVIEFADFECPYCRRLEPAVRELLARYPSAVRLYYRHYPLTDVHPHALGAAKATVCAEQQHKFWEFHDALFAETAALDEQLLARKAADLGLNRDKFTACLADPRTEQIVAADARAGAAAGVVGTPAMFINGRFIDGAVPLTRLVRVVEDELQRRNLAADARP